MDSMYPDFDYDYTPPSTGWPFDPHPLDVTLYSHRHPRLRTAQACEKLLRRTPFLLALPRAGPALRIRTSRTRARAQQADQIARGVLRLVLIGVKLEPLSSCVPLGLGLPPSTNGSINGNGSAHHSGYTNANPHVHAPLNAHLPTGAAKRFSLPASLPLPGSLLLDTQASSYGYPVPASAYHGHADDCPPSSAYTSTSDSGSRRGSFDPSFPPFPLERGVKGGYGYEEEPAVYGGHPLEHHHFDMDLDRIDLDHHNHRAFPLEAGYALSHRLAFPNRPHEQGGIRSTSGSPRAVSDVLGLALGRRPGPELGISLNMGLTRGSSMGAGARSLSSGSTGSTDDSA
ncbi:hypothetical protein B0H13DRAFT_2652307 [Mycena leptocephala]|nr:hypothetical protein B0H13DRAFT_2652307 [Mycena leptocephala]